MSTSQKERLAILERERLVHKENLKLSILRLDIEGARTQLGLLQSVERKIKRLSRSLEKRS